MTNEAEFDVNDIKYGLMVIDPTPDEDDMVTIVHFVGYITEPTEETIKQLWDELNTDETFGLVGKMDGMVIMKASEEITASFIPKNDE